jgi:hypothetical protein
MKKFTKTYNVNVNEKQRAALSQAFKVDAQYFLNEKNVDVDVVVSSFKDKKIIAHLYAGNVLKEVRVIGPNGGLTLV